MKMTSVSSVARVKKDMTPSHGACRLARPWASSLPSEGASGGRPKPRKSSDVSNVIEPVRMNGRNVAVATIALGSTWRRRIRRSPAPSARAAVTYWKLRARSTSARTRPTSAIQLKATRMPSSQKTFDSTMLARMISTNRIGSPAQISISRWPKRSTLPPR